MDSANKTLRVLLVEDDPADVLRITRLLPMAEITTASTLSQARNLLGSVFDVAIVDVSLPDARGATAVEELAGHGAFPVIVLTQTDSEMLAALAAESGAWDILTKATDLEARLTRSVRFCSRRFRAQLRATDLIEGNPDALLVLGTDSKVKYANAKAGELFGEGLEGTVFEFPVDGETTTEMTLLDERVIDVRRALLPDTDDRLFSCRDLTDRVRAWDRLERANEKLELLSTRDPLTGLSNRRGLEHELLRVLASARREGGIVSAILVDVDGLGRINEAEGYPVGDAVLSGLAMVIQDALRDVDFVGRVGGDEFFCVLPSTTVNGAVVAADKIRARLGSTALPIPGINVEGVSVSVGVVALSADTDSLTQAIELAQVPLRQSKLRSSHRPARSRRTDSSDSLFQVIASPDMLEVAVQAIVDLKDPSQRADVEILVRPKTSQGNPTPDEFFLTARRQDVLGATDLLCLRRCMAARHRLDLKGRVHVNLFPSTLLETPIDQILELLDPAVGVVIELNEHEFVGDTSALREPIEALRAAGALIALDDVGFGRGSLESLLLLDPDYVKIDSRLVQGVAHRPDSARIVSRLLTCVSSMGSQSIAEGIETQADADCLIELGVRYGQGFLFDGPGDAS